MKIENLKDLNKLIQLCRKTGVEAITVDGIELKLGNDPIKPSKRVSNRPNYEQDTVKTDELTPEQMLFWSSQGPIPEEEETN